MAGEFNAAELLKGARTASGLTQRELARRAGTSQSVIVRVETGQTSPGSDTLARLLGAAGFEALVELVPAPVLSSHTLDDIARILALSPEERLLEVRNLSRFDRSARRV